MTDLETRLTEALRGAGERAPHPGDLVAPARAWLRRRRRTTVAVVAAAVAVVAIPVGIQLADQRTEPEVTTIVPDDWRTESFRDLTLRVPADWGYDGGPDWCAGDGAPAIDRGEGFQTRVDCDPRLTYGVQFRALPAEVHERPKGVPVDAVVDVVGTGSTSAWIVAESQEQLVQIVASAREIEDVDAKGCPPVVDPDAQGTGDRVSVCRYDSGDLEQSELLSVADSQALARAVARSTPTVAADYDLLCPPYSYRQPAITLRSSELSVDILPSSSCRLAGSLMDEGVERLVTEDVLYWALSPGALIGRGSGLPLPEEPRTAG